MDENRLDNWEIQVSNFLEQYRLFPEAYEEFTEMILTPNQLVASDGTRLETVDSMLKRKAEFYLAERIDIYLDVAVISQDIKTGCNSRGCYCKKRRVEGQCWAWFSHPKIEDIVGDIEECVRAAVTAAIIAAIWADPDAATPAFKATIVACLELKGIEWANEIGIGCYKHEERGQWIPCEN
ncbi:hypothetical protein [Peribacillus phoenicis]|uniref:hypothetical protein n=1 Tax=unclassified Peribacillus TaxID=2675266 RepID=UPI0039A30B3F